MPRPKKIKEAEIVEVATETAPIVPIALLPTDYGREDINDIAKKVNELIYAIQK